MSVDIRADLRLPVEAVATPTAQSTVSVVVAASAEEGEVLFSHPSYILWLYYTTDGETVAPTVGALRAQVRRVEAQVPSVGTRVNLRLPVVAAATPIAQTTARPIEFPSAEEGEISSQQTNPLIEQFLRLRI